MRFMIVLFLLVLWIELFNKWCITWKAEGCAKINVREQGPKMFFFGHHVLVKGKFTP